MTARETVHGRPEGEPGERERVYDEKLAPLVAQIIEICNTHDISMVATFNLARPGDDTLRCSTALPGKDGWAADLYTMLEVLGLVPRRLPDIAHTLALILKAESDGQPPTEGATDGRAKPPTH